MKREVYVIHECLDLQVHVNFFAGLSQSRGRYMYVWRSTVPWRQRCGVIRQLCYTAHKYEGIFTVKL